MCLGNMPDRRRKAVLAANAVLFLYTCLLMVFYEQEGSLWLKGMAASGFLAIGLVNFMCDLGAGNKMCFFPLFKVLGLSACLGGDILLNIHFAAGAVLFALGHVLYCVAYCAMKKPKLIDLLPGICLFGLILVAASRLSGLHFPSASMRQLCIIYALLISMMAGKAISNFCRERNSVTFILVAGSVLFLASDAMLGIRQFCYWPKIPHIVSLSAYFFAQCLLGHSLFWQEKIK